MNTIIIAFFTALLVSLSVHYLIIIHVEKWFDAFLNEESKVFEKYAKEITEIVKKNL